MNCYYLKGYIRMKKITRKIAAAISATLALKFTDIEMLRKLCFVG